MRLTYLPYVKGAVRRVLMSAGLDFYARTGDRRVLEQVVLPWFAAQPDVGTVLFVGCEWYTRGYRRFFANVEYWTIDIDPRKRRYGARHHIIDSVTNLRDHFSVAALDCIICNGVVGWGLNEGPEIEEAFSACYDCLRSDGHFVLGWNDASEHLSQTLANSEALSCFHPTVFPPLGERMTAPLPPWRHRYAFFRK